MSISFIINRQIVWWIYPSFVIEIFFSSFQLFIFLSNFWFSFFVENLFCQSITQVWETYLLYQCIQRYHLTVNYHATKLTMDEVYLRLREKRVKSFQFRQFNMIEINFFACLFLSRQKRNHYFQKFTSFFSWQHFLLAITFLFNNNNTIMYH